MTRRRGVQHRRRPHRASHHQLPVADHAVLPGWCATEAELPELRKATHDQLIAIMGTSRRGGVTWHQATGDTAVKIAADLARPDDPPEAAEFYAGLLQRLQTLGGYLVVASAPGVRP